MEIDDICKIFNLNGRLTVVKRLTNGNINQTYKVTFCENSKETSYIIQCINKLVFTEPVNVMFNIERVTGYISNQINDSSKREVLEFLNTRYNTNYFIDNIGNYYRCCYFIPDSETYNLTDNLYIINQAGKAFGKFQYYLRNFNPNELKITIKDFHNIEKRISQLTASFNENVCNRASDIVEEYNYLLSAGAKTERLTYLIKNKLIKQRVVHNDTKLNNVLFDKYTKKSLAVIDLDTVMPGFAAFDYGDALRFCANDTFEDEVDIKKVNFNLDKFSAFSKGFFQYLRNDLTENEINTFVDGVFYMTLECAVRFLCDYIDNDKYFKIDYPLHNLMRARAQIALLKSIEKKENEMNAIIKQII